MTSREATLATSSKLPLSTFHLRRLCPPVCPSHTRVKTLLSAVAKQCLGADGRTKPLTSDNGGRDEHMCGWTRYEMETTCNTCHWTTCGYLDPSLLRCGANSLLGGWRIKHSCCSPPSPRSEQPWFQLLSSCFSLALLPNRWVTMATSPWTASFLSRLSQFYHVLCPAIDLSLLYTVQENVGKAIIETDNIF